MTGPALLPARPVRRTAPAGRPGPPEVAFGLFLAVTAVLVIRPSEVIPSLAGVPVFQLVILACLVVAGPWVLVQLTPTALRAAPATACVLGVAVAIPASLLTQGATDEAVTESTAFLKVVAFYLLLTAVVDTPGRLRTFIAVLTACVAAHTALAIISFHGWAEVPGMTAVMDTHTNAETGEVTTVARMCGVGLFGNPNDVSRLMVVGIALTVFLAGESPWAVAPALLGLAGMFGYGLVLTQSRGGLSALFVTALVTLQLRYGGRRTALIGLLAVPALSAVVGGGRQADMSVEGGTGQQRVQLWMEGFEALRESPVFGIGAEQYSALTGGLGAHNSYVGAFVELGLVGGACFLSAVAFSLWQSYRLRPSAVPRLPAHLARVQPYLVGVMAGYAVGMLTSHRNYLMPTYLLIGLGTVYQRLAGAAAPRLVARLDGPLAVRLSVACALALAALYGFARFSVRWQ